MFKKITHSGGGGGGLGGGGADGHLDILVTIRGNAFGSFVNLKGYCIWSFLGAKSGVDAFDFMVNFQGECICRFLCEPRAMLWVFPLAKS